MRVVLTQGQASPLRAGSLHYVGFHGDRIINSSASKVPSNPRRGGNNRDPQSETPPLTGWEGVIQGSWIRQAVTEALLAMKWDFFIVGMAIVMAVLIYQLLGLIPLSEYVASSLTWFIVILSVYSLIAFLIRTGIVVLIRRLQRR